MKRPCSAKGCGGYAHTRGWCRTHYSRWLRTGTVVGRRRPTARERFLTKVKKVARTGCWEWQGHVTRYGYAQFNPTHDKPVRAHRYSYEEFRGPIPDGLHLDHLCRNRRCVNPEHLEAVTSRQNWLRGESVSVLNLVKLQCKHGHAFTRDNTAWVTIRGRRARSCRACSRRRKREASALRAAERVPQTHCIRGHLLENPNLVASAKERGNRACLACARARAVLHRIGGDLQAVSDEKYAVIMGRQAVEPEIVLTEYGEQYLLEVR